MTWFAFPQGTGTLQVFNLNGAAEKAMVATFAHGYATMQEAVAKPNANPDSAQTIQIAADQQTAGALVGGGATGVLEAGTYTISTKKYVKQGSNVSGAADIAEKAAKGAADATGLGSVTDFLQGLTDKNLWIRAAKITIGGAILLIGIAKLTGAGGIAAKAVKIAPLL